MCARGKGCSPSHKAFCRAKNTTNAARCAGNKCEIISKWLLMGLAVVFSRPNWQFLAKRHSDCHPTAPPRRYHRGGYLAGLVDKRALPCVLPWHNALSEPTGSTESGSVLHDICMDALHAERAWSKFDTFYRTMACSTTKQTANKQNKQQAEQAEQAEQATVNNHRAKCPGGPPSSDRVTAARSGSQCVIGRLQLLPLAQTSDCSHTTRGAVACLMDSKESDTDDTAGVSHCPLRQHTLAGKEIETIGLLAFTIIGKCQKI